MAASGGARGTIAVDEARRHLRPVRDPLGFPRELRYGAHMNHLSTSLAGLALLLAGCASITPIPYTPQPSRIADPAAEAKSLIEANTTGGCVAKPEVQPPLLTVKFVCREAIGNMVVRLDHVESVTLQQSGEWYRVLVHHDNGAEDFAWTSKQLDDIQRLADALTALSKSAAKK